MVVTTTAQLFVKTPQFVEETTEGTTPTASPSFTSCGPCSSLSINIDGQFVDVAQIGSEDLISIIQGLNKYEVKMKLNLTASTFIKYFINSANYATPTSTVSKSFSILWSIYLNGIENYIIFKGARAKDITLNVEVGKPDEATVTITGVNISTPSSSHGLTTPTFAATPSGAVWGHLDGGSTPVSWNASGINCKKFSITIARNTEPDYILGQGDPFSTQPHGRRISGDFTNLWTATTIEADSKAGTARTLAVVLKSATSTLTLSNCYAVTVKRDADAGQTEATIEAITFRALTASIT